MFTLLALHGSSRDETDLARYSLKIAPDARLIAPRGAFPDGSGLTFFKRRADRSIVSDDIVSDDVVALARQWALQEMAALSPASEKLVVAGYSSGAVFAEALLSVMPDKFSGAILMRPEPLSFDFAFPDLAGMPILILAGKHDERRRPDDAPHLAGQLEAAGSEVTLHVLDSGHGWASLDEDIFLTREWLDGIWPSERPLRPQNDRSEPFFPEL